MNLLDTPAMMNHNHKQRQQTHRLEEVDHLVDCGLVLGSQGLELCGQLVGGNALQHWDQLLEGGLGDAGDGLFGFFVWGKKGREKVMRKAGRRQRGGWVSEVTAQRQRGPACN